MNIGGTIREFRILKGMKQQELAERIGVTGTYMSMIEHRKAKPSPEVIAKVAKELELTPGELIVLSMGTKLNKRDDIKAAAKVVIDHFIEYLIT